MIGIRSTWLVASASLLSVLAAAPALAETTNAASPDVGAPESQSFAVHGQATLLGQANPSFHSPYAGPNSLPADAEGRETADFTLYAGARIWPGAELWINPEIDQGFGLGNTLGLAGFSSGEAYKVGAARPYLKLQRLFVRQTIDLGGDRQTIDAAANQLGGAQTADRFVLTVGKFSVVDIFDANSYAHDPRADFMNWTVIDTGSFDYAADAWGYSVGAAAEWYVGRWTLRGGLFNLSTQPNSPALEFNFSQYQAVGEIEERHQFGGHPGKLKLAWFLTEGRMGRFAAAVALSQQSGQPADIAAVRRFQSRQGISFNLEQEVADGVGVFAHGGVSDGALETFEFTDVDQTLAAGVSIKGERWSRLDDTFGLAGAVSGVSKAHQHFLDAGGLGILVGDGRLPHPGAEQVLETYYDFALGKAAHLSLDYQCVANPAYNRDRGPVSIFGARLHAQF